MTTSRVTIIAELKDHLTGPSKQATKAIEDLGKATEKVGKTAEASAKAAEHQATAVDKAAAAAGRYTDKQGRLREANGRFVSAATKAREAAEKQAQSTGKQERASSRLERVLGRVDRALGRAAGGGTTRLQKAMGMAQGGTQRLQRALGRLDANPAVDRFRSGMTRMAGYAEGASNTIDRAMGRIGRSIGLAAGALAGASLYGGVNRLTALESADVKLEVGGYDEQARAGIMSTVDQAVTGTPFALNEAATAATQYLASGVTPEDLGSKLGTTVDMAAVYDMDLGETSTILSKILATGTLQGDEVNQLLERGMPIYAALAKQLGVEQSQVKGMISEGDVSAEDLFAAIAPSVEGGAGRLGDTTKGVYANMRTAFSRSGATFLAPIMDPAKDFMGTVTQMLKDSAPFFTALGERLAPAVTAAADAAPRITAALAPFEGTFLRVADAASDLLPYILEGFANWLTVLTPVLVPLLEVTGVLLEMAGPLLPVLIPLVFGLGAAFKTWWIIDKLRSPVKGLFGLLRGHPIGWVMLAVYGLAKGFAWLYDNVEWVKTAVDGLVEVFDNISESIRDVGTAIEELIRDKFPMLNGVMDNAEGNVANLDGGRVKEAIDGTRVGGNPIFGYIQERTGLGGFLDSIMPWRKDDEEEEDTPAHAVGGWTGSGAHKAIVGERGPEFVTNAWASRKIASTHPGALETMNATGRLPVSQAPAPSTALPSVGELHVHTPATDGASFARQFADEWNRRTQAQELTYATPHLRGAY